MANIKYLYALIFGCHNEMVLKVKAKSLYFGVEGIELRVVSLSVDMIAGCLERLCVYNNESVAA